MKLKYYLRGIGIGMIVAAFLLGRHVGASLTDDEIRARARELGMVEDSGVLQLAQSGGTQSGKDAQTRAEAARQDDKAPEEEPKAAEKEKEPKTVSFDTVSGADGQSGSVSADTGAAAVSDNGGKKASGEKPEETETDGQKKAPEETKPEEKKPEETKPEEKKPEETKAEEKKPENKEDRMATAGASAGQGGSSAKTGSSSAKAGDSSEKQDSSSAKPSSSGTYTIHITSGDNSYTVSKRLEEAGVVDSAIAFDGYLCAQGYDRRITVGDHTLRMDASYEEIGKNLAAIP